MKYLLPLLFAASIHAGSVTLVWDAPLTGSPTNYILVAATNLVTFTNYSGFDSRISVGTNRFLRIDDLRPGAYSFAVFAEQNNVLSDPSNTHQIEVPKSVMGLRSIYVEHSAEVAGTNWQTVGFFKLKLGP